MTEAPAASMPELTAAPARRVHELVSEHALAHPDAPAVLGKNETITWKELDQASNRLAHYLQTLGVGAEVPVALYFERSPSFVVAALAVFKAGGAYLPLDPAYPPDRIDQILRDAQTPVLLSHKWMAAGLRSGSWTNVDLDMDAPKIKEQPSTPTGVPVAAADMAYLIYTSGSTGRPKGVEVMHANLSHLIDWHKRAFGVTSADRASQLAGLAFDAAVWEIWCHLAAGASLHLIDEASRRSPEGLRDWLVQQRITIAFVPTVMAEHLITFDWPRTTALKTMLTGADTLHRYPVEGLPFVLVNNYGPTECTVLVTSGRVPLADPSNQVPTIGRPIDDTRIYILGEDLHPVLAGEPGELCAAGPQVARGYRNLPELTTQKFIIHPIFGEKMYRTGDRARLLPDGEIAFLGRIDEQIKIRGYRVEPDDIVAQLNSHPRVANSTVIASADESGNQQLIAYLVLGSGGTLTGAEIRKFLASRLPEYMIPAAFAHLKALPTTANGKCDREALPKLSAENLLQETGDNSAREAGSATEDRLTVVVNTLMAPRQIGRDDNFFFVGGHSMLAAQLVARIRETFGASLTLRQLFEAPTISALSAVVDRHLSAR